MTHSSHYTFGDSDVAATRLRLLAEAFDEPTRQFLKRALGGRPVETAVDLGCGPGHTTRLLHELSRAQRTIGIDASAEHVARASAAPQPGVSYAVHDVRELPLPVRDADLVFVRFLLTHLSDPAASIAGWMTPLRAGGVLLVQETARMDSDDPVFRRYYELVGELQRRYGQSLYIGRDLAKVAAAGGTKVFDYREHPFERSARIMAGLHSLNIETWSRDPIAVEAFDAAELAELHRELTRIAQGARDCAPVQISLGELTLEAGEKDA